jgi:hypothetical protein
MKISKGLIRGLEVMPMGKSIRPSKQHQGKVEVVVVMAVPDSAAE